MSYRKLTYLTSIFFILLSGTFFYSAFQMKESNYGVGPQYFPQVLSIMLIALCLLDIWITRKKDDKKIEIPNLGLIILTIILITSFFIMWSLSGQFYIFAFLFMVISLLLYTPYKRTIKRVLTISIISLVIVFAVYLLFSVAMSFDI